MSLVQDDHVVQAFTANTPNEPLDVRILPRTPGGDHDLLDPHMLHPLPKRGAIDPVPIAQEIAWRFFPRECIHDLLGGPRGCATKRTDTMEGNSRRLYQGGCEPLGRRGWRMQTSGERAALKRYWCGRGKLPRCQAWLREGMATQKEAGFNLRENSPLAQHLARWASERTERLPRLDALCYPPKG
jgi:hypothetical protein